MADLICPKCGSEWRSFERSGITIDSCTGCRGVFLDRGELERLVDAESQYAGRDDHHRGLTRNETEPGLPPAPLCHCVSAVR